MKKFEKMKMVQAKKPTMLDESVDIAGGTGCGASCPQTCITTCTQTAIDQNGNLRAQGQG